MKRNFPKKKTESDLFMRPDEFQRFLNVVYDKYPREAVMWDIMGNSGLRVSELLMLTPENFDFDTNHMNTPVLKQKRKDGEIPMVRMLMPGKTMRIVQEYIHLFKIKEDCKLFDITRQHAHRLFKVCVKLTGLNPRYSPHCLRHMHGVLVAKTTNGNLIVVAKRLRHKSVRNVERYLHLLEEDEKKIVAALEKERSKK